MGTVPVMTRLSKHLLGNENVVLPSSIAANRENTHRKTCSDFSRPMPPVRLSELGSSSISTSSTDSNSQHSDSHRDVVRMPSTESSSSANATTRYSQENIGFTTAIYHAQSSFTRFESILSNNNLFISNLISRAPYSAITSPIIT